MTIVLIGCGKSKQATTTPVQALSLYTGQLFQSRLHYALNSGNRYWIISAKHGLLAPQTPVLPYDQKLGGSQAEQRLWGRAVLTRLVEEIEMLGRQPKHCTLEIHAGENYVAAIRSQMPYIAEHKMAIETPLAHMGIGEQLRWYNVAADLRHT